MLAGITLGVCRKSICGIIETSNNLSPSHLCGELYTHYYPVIRSQSDVLNLLQNVVLTSVNFFRRADRLKAFRDMLCKDIKLSLLHKLMPLVRVASTNDFLSDSNHLLLSNMNECVNNQTYCHQ